MVNRTDLLSYEILKLKTEIDELTTTNNSQIATIRELRAEVERLQFKVDEQKIVIDISAEAIDGYKSGHETLRDTQTLAADLAGALLKLLSATDTTTMPMHILSKSQAALDRYRQATEKIKPPA